MMAKYLNRHERCRECYHLESCDAWVKHGLALYDDFIISVTSLPADFCPYYTPKILPGQPGNWVMRSNGYRVRPECSVCGSSAGSSLMRFCPNCGAKMDEEVVEDA